MQTIRALLTLNAFLACAAAVAQGHGQTGDIEVELEAADQARLGVSTIRLQAVQAPGIIDGIGRVLNVNALAQLDADIETADALASASANEAKRLAVLAADDQNASRQSLEAARAQSASDEIRLGLARRRLELEWGSGLAALDSAQRRQIIEQIAIGRTAFLRIDPLAAQSIIGAAVQLRPDASAPAIETQSLGPAAITDPQLQTNGLLVTVHGNAAMDLRPGRVLAAEIIDAKNQDGVILPRSALVRIDGMTWVYLRRSRDEFVRREVIGPRMRNDGWFVSTGFVPGEEVVDTGAGSLLAVERGGEPVDDD